MEKTQRTPPTAPEEPRWELDVALSDSPTPPHHIVPRKTGIARGSTKKRSRRPEEGNELEDEGTVEGMTIDAESDPPSPDSDEETGPGNGKSSFDDGESVSNNEESGPNDVDLTPSQAEPGSGMTGVSSPQDAKGSTANPLSSRSLKKLIKSSSKSKLKLLSPPRKVKSKSATPGRTRSSTGSKQASPSSLLRNSGPAQPAAPTKVEPRPPLSKVNPLKSPSHKERNLGPSPPQNATPNKTPGPSNAQSSSVDPSNPAQLKDSTQPIEKSAPPEKVVQGGPPDSVDTSSNQNPGAMAAARDPSPSRVAEPEPNQNETPAESKNRPDGFPAKSPPSQPMQNSYKSDIESLYASSSPEKTATEMEPIELDSDPDFELMEKMLLSHRGPSSQSQLIKKELTAQPPVSSQTQRPLKRQRSRPSPNKFSQALTQIPQADLKPAKRPRVKGPHSPDSGVVLNERRKHPEFWDLDGTVILQVDDVLFRLMRSTLSKASPWFQRMFSEEFDHLEIMAGCPLYMIEEDFSHLDFANFLHGLENGLEYALNPPHYLRIVSIFRVASLLKFNTLRRWSLGCLEKQWLADLPPPSKPSKFGSMIPWAEETLTIAHLLDVPQLIKRAYWELCTRSEFGRIDAELYDNEVEEIMPTRSRLPRSVLMDLTRLRERLLPEWTRITRTPPIGVPCARTTQIPSTFTPTTNPTPCSLDYANWYRVVSEVEVNDMTVDDRRMDPISALEVMIVEIDWEKEGGFCTDCVRAWKVIWTKDRQKIWKNLGDWLGLDAGAEP